MLVAVLQRDHVELGQVLRVIGGDALDDALGGADREAGPGGVGGHDRDDGLAAFGRDELADRGAAGQAGGVRGGGEGWEFEYPEPDQPAVRGQHADRSPGSGRDRRDDYVMGGAGVF